MKNPAVAERHRAQMIKYTDEYLLAQLLDQAGALGRTPTVREIIPREKVYRKRFGSYNQAVLLAGLEPNLQLPPSYLDNDRPRIPLALRFRVLRRDGFRCQYCGGTPQDGYLLHVDHKIPVSKGGETTEENLVTACSLCNNGKSDTTPP
jgi:HNH endonuclease/Homing endonuclease associated repeat